jgi:hypothetical protein
MLSVPPIFWPLLGLVSASPASEIPLELELELVPELFVLALPPELDLLDELDEPHAASAIAHAIKATGTSVNRNRRIYVLLLLLSATFFNATSSSTAASGASSA